MAGGCGGRATARCGELPAEGLGQTKSLRKRSQLQELTGQTLSICFHEYKNPVCAARLLLSLRAVCSRVENHGTTNALCQVRIKGMEQEKENRLWKTTQERNSHVIPFNVEGEPSLHADGVLYYQTKSRMPQEPGGLVDWLCEFTEQMGKSLETKEPGVTRVYNPSRRVGREFAFEFRCPTRPGKGNARLALGVARP